MAESIFLHIAIGIISDGLTVKVGQSVVDIISKCRVIGCTDNVTCRVILEGFLGQDYVAEILGDFLDYSTKLIVSIAEFGVFVKCIL